MFVRIINFFFSWVSVEKVSTDVTPIFFEFISDKDLQKRVLFELYVLNQGNGLDIEILEIEMRWKGKVR